MALECFRKDKHLATFQFTTKFVSKKKENLTYNPTSKIYSLTVIHWVGGHVKQTILQTEKV
jgi:hypothetical protein